MKAPLLATMAAVLLTGCTSISITETKDEKGNTIAAVKVSATAAGDVEVFATKMAKRISSVCAALRERAAAAEAATAAAEAAAAEAAAAAAEAAAAEAAATASPEKADLERVADEAREVAKVAENRKQETANMAKAAQAKADATPLPIVVDLQSVLGLLKAARELLPVHEYFRTCLLQSAETQGPKAYKSPRRSPQRNSGL